MLWVGHEMASSEPDYPTSDKRALGREDTVVQVSCEAERCANNAQQGSGSTPGHRLGLRQKFH